MLCQPQLEQQDERYVSIFSSTSTLFRRFVISYITAYQYDFFIIFSKYKKLYGLIFLIKPKTVAPLLIKSLARFAPTKPLIPVDKNFLFLPKIFHQSLSRYESIDFSAEANSFNVFIVM